MRRVLALAIALCAAIGLTACGGPSHAHKPFRQRPFSTPYGTEAHSPTFGAHPKSIPLPPHLPRTAAASTLLMLDSVDTKANSSTWNGIADPPVVAGYLPPSSWPTYSAFVSEFPHAYHVAVDVQSYAYGVHGAARSCLDVEPGDATPSQAGAWAKHEASNGFKPCLYSDLSEMPSVRASVNAQHLSQHVFYWCADWTNYAHLDPGCDAVQWTSHYANRNIDGSTVDYAFVGKSTTPPPPPKPTVRCYRAGWPQPSSDRSLCLRVRAHDSYLGHVVSTETGYLKVTGRNLSNLDRQLRGIQANIRTENARIALDIRKGDSYTRALGELRTSYANEGKVQGDLEVAGGRKSVEQAKLNAAQTALSSDLKKYGYG